MRLKREAVADTISGMASTVLQVLRLGGRSWSDALVLQEAAVARVKAGAPDMLLLVEHPPTFSFGRRQNVDPDE